MLKPMTIASVALCLAACATTAPQSASLVASVDAAQADTVDMVICRKETPKGSKFRKTVCVSGEEYASRAQRGREAIRGVTFNRGSVNNDVMSLDN